MKRAIAGLAWVVLLIGSSCKDEIDLGGGTNGDDSAGEGGEGAAGNSGGTSGASSGGRGGSSGMDLGGATSTGGDAGSGTGGTAGVAGSIPSSGAAGDGSPGGAGTGATTGGNAGSAQTGGLGGAGASNAGNTGSAGTNEACDGVRTSCSASCLALPLIAGCGADAERSVLCTIPLLSNRGFGCGVRLDDERIFHVDAPSPTENESIANPFGSIPGFRTCTQAEVDATNCEDAPSAPSIATVRLEITNNRSTPIWVADSGQFCSSLEIDRLPDVVRVPRLQNNCACGLFDPVASARISRLNPGASLSVVWDGRESEFRSSLYACGSSTRRCTGPRYFPSPAGRYRAGIAVYLDSSDWAMQTYVANCGDAATCLVSGSVLPGVRTSCFDLFQSPPPFRRVDFDLPASGELVVPIPID